MGGTSMKDVGAQALLEVRRRFLVGSGRPTMLMLVRSAAALATMRLVLLYDDVDVYALESLKASSGVFGDSF